jgi:protease I
MEKILVLAGDAAEDLDAMYPIFRLREAGYEVHIAAPTRRKVKLVVHDFEEGWDAYTERPGRHLPVDLAFSEVEPEGYAALVIPGGRAPEYIRNDSDVARICTHFFEQNLPVGLVCHGVQVPAALGLLRGRTVSGFPPLKPDFEAAGATFEEGPDVVDGNIVSCTGWPDMPEFSRAFMRVLERAAVSS